jgi:ribosome biogenesis protein Nip4
VSRPALAGASAGLVTASAFNLRPSLPERKCLSLWFERITRAIVREELDRTYLYSFDDGFDTVADITRLTTATTPFEE